MAGLCLRAASTGHGPVLALNVLLLIHYCHGVLLDFDFGVDEAGNHAARPGWLRFVLARSARSPELRGILVIVVHRMVIVRRVRVRMPVGFLRG